MLIKHLSSSYEAALLLSPPTVLPVADAANCICATLLGVPKKYLQ